MKRIDLVKIEHDLKIGQTPTNINPNVNDDCIFYLDGKAIGFYMKQLPKKMCDLAEIANAEFRSERVPKTLLNRATAIAQTAARPDIKEKYKDKKESGVSQMSVIIGAIPPKPMVRRTYKNMSSVHSVKSARTFIKSMLLLAIESEKLIKELLPEQYETQLELFKTVDQQYKFGNLFTSSISNFNISAPYHRDTGNIPNTVNVIICKKLNSTGGDLTIPDYGATIGQQDNSIVVYPAWMSVHGVTPIIPTTDGGYRNSLVFYPLKAFKSVD